MPELTRGQKVNKTYVALMRRSLEKMALASILVGEHLIVINSQFDGTVIDVKRIDRNIKSPQNWILHSFVSRDNFGPRRFTQTD